MDTTVGKSRTLSLRAPIANEEERALFQRRLAMTSLLVFTLAAVFWVATTASLAFMAPEHVRHMWDTATAQVQLATTFAGLGVWIYVRRGKRSASTLGLIDAVSAVGICLGWCIMISYEQHAGRSELVALLACTYTLVARAALIPSTPARTAVLGGIALTPLLPVTYAIHQAAPLGARGPLGPSVYMSIWLIVAVACTTAISHVIYGLQLQVRKAMQLGQYLLEEKIGEGGMGMVFRASHAMLRRPTAIKLLTGTTGQAIERFEREVQITARLTHPNTVAVFDYGRTPDGVFYYAMEYLEGISLEDLVRDHGPQPPARVVHLLLQVCGALEEAHAAGLVHRDIKPANVMLTIRGGVPDVVKVLDFGLVKERIGGRGDATLSAVNTILGTPHYMAPEAIVEPNAVDGRADIYAVGATAFYLLTGERVFDGATLVEVCSQHLHQAPASPRDRRADVPEALEQVVLRCLAKKPEERPRDAAALAEMLRACGVGEWTRADASRWWRENGRKKNGATRPAPSESEPSAAFGKTVAVALDDRAAS